jgi:DUF1009 family protein
MTPAITQPKVGLIAGWGRFPILVAQSLRRQGYRVYCLGIDGHADHSLADICYDYQTVGLAKMGRHTRYFRRHGIGRVTLAGKVHKVLLFHKFFVLRHLPDFYCVRTFFPHFITGARNRNDDSLLSAAVGGYQRRGIEIVAATELVPELLVRYGQLAGPRISRSQQQDIEFAWQLAKKMGDLDVGQSVAVKGRAVLAVEAVEGTDQCIRRAGMLCPAGGFTVVKVAKPHQDMRFDVPTIGVGTVQTMLDAGGRVLAVEADKTILVDRDNVVRFAKENGISIVAVRADQVGRELVDAA